MDRGGIVQQAMQQDLLSLYHDFVEDLQHQQQQQQVAEFALTTSGCGCPGRAFGCFRKVFGQHKMALVHTRTVPPRTNLNAYTQLLYATCLELIPNFPYHHHHHQSATTTATTDMSMDNEDDLLLLLLRRAAHGLFALYTLYQTNPHRRQTNGTTLPLLRLLPMSLQGDNPKGLYRRSFAQKIRIDRERYLLLLQWNELALAQQAQCRQQQLHQQHHHPLCNKKDRGSNRDQSSLSSSSSSSCRCGGVAVDYCRVWERLKDCWDYSEYTGPRGVEGLAGHATYGLAQPQEQQDDDNDDDDDDDDGNGFSRMMESWATQPVVHNNNNNNNNNNTHHYDDIVTMIQTYRTKIKAIQLPPENHNTKRRRRHHHHYQTQRIKKCLEPLYQQPQQHNYWDALLSKRLKGNNDAKEKAPPPPTVLCLGQANQTPPTAATMINNNNDNDNIGGASATAETTTKPSYRLVLSPLIPKGVQQGIQRALDGLLLREQDLVERRTRKPPLPPQLVHAHKEVHKGDDDDDVSSMGHLGGVSVLMTTTDAQKNDDDCNKNHVVATTTTPMVPRLVRNNNNNNNNNNNTVPVAPPSKRQGFLTMDLPNERTSARHDDDDDNDEFDSDLSSVSDGDDDDDDDYVSAATTAVGKQALDQLLASALDDGKPSMAAANQKTIKSIRTTVANDDDDDSLRAFTASAEQLELLSTVSSTTAVSVAAGTQALRTLLSKAKDDYSPSPTETTTTTNTKRRKGQQQQQPWRRPKSGGVVVVDDDEDDEDDEDDTETESQATLFAAGQHALQELLSTAQTKTKPVKKQRIKDDEDDEAVPPTKHETALARKRRAPAKDGTTARKRRAPAKDIVSEEEDTIANDVVSTATGSSVGQGALQSLLSKATTRRGKRQQDRAPNATTNKDDDNAPTTRALSCEDSVVSEAVGKKALAQLLAASHK